MALAISKIASISDLYSCIEEKNNERANSVLKSLPDGFKNRVFGEVWRLDGARPEAGDKWGELNAVVDLSRLQAAVDRVLRAELEEMPESDQRKVYGKVYEFAHIVTEDIKWGEHHVFDDMARLAKAVDALQNSSATSSPAAPVHTAEVSLPVYPAYEYVEHKKPIPELINDAPMRWNPEKRRFQGIFSARESIPKQPTPELIEEIELFLSSLGLEITPQLREAFERLKTPESDSTFFDDVTEINNFTLPDVSVEKASMYFYVMSYCVNRGAVFAANSRFCTKEEWWQMCFGLYKQYKELKKLETTITDDLTSVESFYWLRGSAVNPSYFGMVLLACYYEEKYGLSLYIESKESFAKKLKEGKYPKDHPFGVVFHGEGKHANHVTPRIISYNSGIYQILDLDSVSRENCRIYLPGTIPEVNFTELRLDTHRQADTVSCRNDSIVILVNALLDLKEQNTNDIFEYTKGATFFPAPWAKTSQTSCGLGKTDPSAPVRTKRGPISLNAFIDRHKLVTTSGQVHRQYLLYKGYKMANRIAYLLENRESCRSVWAKFEARTTPDLHEPIPPLTAPTSMASGGAGAGGSS